MHSTSTLTSALPPVERRAYRVNLVEHADVVAELERRTEHDDERRKHKIYVQTLQRINRPDTVPSFL